MTHPLKATPRRQRLKERLHTISPESIARAKLRAKEQIVDPVFTPADTIVVEKGAKRRVGVVVAAPVGTPVSFVKWHGERLPKAALNINLERAGTYRVHPQTGAFTDETKKAFTKAFRMAEK